MEHPCPCCGKEMTNYTKPQRPKFVCDECCCDESGLEVDYCEGCGEPYVCGDDKDCDCGEYEQYEYCEKCGHDYPMGETCPHCGGDDDDDDE